MNIYKFLHIKKPFSLIKHEYVKTGMQLAQRHHQVADMIPLGKDVQYSSLIEKMKLLEKEYANSHSSPKHKYQTIDFIGLIMEKGQSMSISDIIPYLEKEVENKKIQYETRNYSEYLDYYYREQEKRIQVIPLNP